MLLEMPAFSLAVYRWAHSRWSLPARRAYRAAMGARLSGAAHIPPRGGALLVGNHAALGLDSFPFSVLCIEEAGRMPRFLGERNLWRIPGLAALLDSLGAVPGTQNNAVSLLRQGELVCVYPGGIDDSFKLASEAYRLQWHGRRGFARVALQARVPIIPFVGEGVDDLLSVVGKERWIGRTLLGSPRYDLPLLRGAWGLPIPRRVPLVYHVLEPLSPDGDPDSPQDVERLRAKTFDRMDSVLRVLRAMRERRRTRCERR